MSDEELATFVKAFESGTPTPAVDPEDIRRMWEFMNRVRAERRDAGVHGLGAVNARLYKDICQPGVNLVAVWVRTGLVEFLHRTGSLQHWEPGSEYEKRVFEVAAVYPMRIGEFDGEEFLRQVGVAAK